MSISLSSSPAYPVVGNVKVTFAATTGNFVRLYVTDAPVGSKLRAELDASDEARIMVFEGDIGESYSLVADVAGVFVFSAEEITKGAATYGGGYQGAPNSYQTETILSTTTALTVAIGQRVVATVAGLTLALWIWGDTIRATDAVGPTGEVTPALTAPVNATARAKAAASASAVRTALVALGGVTVATAIGDIGAVVSDFRAKFNAHIADATAHDSADTDNTIDGERGSVGGTYGTEQSLAEVVKHLAQQYQRHATNTDAANGVGSGDYHDVGGTVADWANVPQPLTGNGITDAHFGLAGLWSAYEAHRVSTTVHDSADATNALASLPPLLELYRRIAAETNAGSPTAPASENSGAVLMTTAGGMRLG